MLRSNWSDKLKIVGLAILGTLAMTWLIAQAENATSRQRYTPQPPRTETPEPAYGNHRNRCTETSGARK